MRKYICGLLIIAIMSLTISSCSTSNDSEEAKAIAEQELIDTMEIQQNDYRGGVIRTLSLKNHILSIMENMKRNNTLIRNDSPNSFWNTQGYQDFVATFLTQSIINDTQWFNEEEASFDETIEVTLTSDNIFTEEKGEGVYEPINNNISIVRNEKDDYSISNITGTLLDKNEYKGNISYRILYDCDKDWCKAYTSLDISSSYIKTPVTTELFEYARINDNTFAIQTSTERLLIKLANVEGDTDIRNREIVEFYYSRLSGGQRTTFKPYEQLPEFNEDGKEIRANADKNKEINKYPLINENGEPATIYGINNSLFLLDKVSAIDYKWVFEDKALQQAIIYKNNTLVVTSYNKLSTKYERFIYSIEEIDPKLVKDIENMVKIEGLVGVVAIKTTEIVPVVTTASTSATSSTDMSPEITSIENADVDTTSISDDMGIDTGGDSADNTASPEESIDNTEISASDTSNESDTSITAETSITDAETTAPISDTAEETSSTEAGV